MVIAVLHAERDTNAEQENVLDNNTEVKIVLEITKKLYTSRVMFSQLTDTGLNGHHMVIAVLHVEKDTNTEQENVLDNDTEVKIVLEITKKLYTARVMFTAQLMDTGLNMENGRVAVKHAEKESRHVPEFVMSQNTVEKRVMGLPMKPENVNTKRNVSPSQFVLARNTNWKNSLA